MFTINLLALILSGFMAVKTIADENYGWTLIFILLAILNAVALTM